MTNIEAELIVDTIDTLIQVHVAAAVELMSGGIEPDEIPMRREERKQLKRILTMSLLDACRTVEGNGKMLGPEVWSKKNGPRLDG